ncbi:hypothetical protein X975_26316, partial [Stegodyphus mimosarum]
MFVLCVLRQLLFNQTSRRRYQSMVKHNDDYACLFS